MKTENLNKCISNGICVKITWLYHENRCIWQMKCLWKYYEYIKNLICEKAVNLLA